MTVVNGWPPVPGVTPDTELAASLTDDADPLVFLTDEEQEHYLLEG